MQIKLGDFLREICIKTVVNNEYPVLTSSKNGIYLQSEYFNKQVASKDNTGYKIIKKGQFTYRAMSDTGEFYPNILKCVDIGIVSPAYPVFEITNRDIIYPQYLQYFFRSNTFRYNISGLEQGSTRTSIKFNKMKNIKIKLPPLLEQKKVIMILDRVGSLIFKRQEQLKYFDELTKSLFIEMFGDLGEDIFGDGLKLLKDVCQINPKKDNYIANIKDFLVSFVPMSAVSESGEIDTTIIKCYDEVKKGFTSFIEDDVLFAKITPFMENGKGAIAKKLKNSVGFGSTEFHVLRPLKDKSNSAWIYYLTSFSHFRKEAEIKMTGSAGQRRVPASFLENYKIALPPIELQNKFANFVRGTDKSKLAVKKSLEELEILKKSLMQKYFA
mgnify:CR=1 FL=1